MIRRASGKISNGNILRVAVGLAILAILIVAVDTRALVAHLAELRPDYLLYAAGCIAVATLLGSYNAYLVVAIDSAVSYVRFLVCYWFSWALGLVVPGQVGDVASLTYLLKRAGLDWSKIMARALLDKVISLTVIAMLATVALLRYSSAFAIEATTVIWVVAAGLALTAAAYLILRRILEASGKRAAWVETMRGSLDDLGRFVKGNPGLVGINFIGTVVKILLIGTAYWYVFLAGGAEDPAWLQVVLLVTMSSLVAYIPVSFNGLGTVEITGILLFSLLGLEEELVLSSYLVLRVTVLAIAWAPSLLILALSGERAD